MKKTIEKIRDRIAYNRIIRIASSCEYDKLKNRHIVDLQEGYLSYFPETGKILTTRNGIVFRNKNQCWYTRKELNELLKQIES